VGRSAKEKENFPSSVMTMLLRYDCRLDNVIYTFTNSTFCTGILNFYIESRY